MGKLSRWRMIKWNWNLACPRIKNMACQRFDWSRSGVQIGFEDIELRVRRQRYWRKSSKTETLKRNLEARKLKYEFKHEQRWKSGTERRRASCRPDSGEFNARQLEQLFQHALFAIYGESLFDICLVCEYASMLPSQIFLWTLYLFDSACMHIFIPPCVAEVM